MSTADRFPKPSDLVPDDELVPPPVKDFHAEHQPSPKRTKRRWEIGFFARKIVQGRLEHLKLLRSLLGPGGRSGSKSIDQGGEAQGGRSQGAIVDSELAAAQAQHNNDGGPVGETRFDIGFFVSVAEEEEDDEES